MNQCPPCSWIFYWGRFEFVQKFAEIFANEYLSPVATTSAVSSVSCSPVATTPVINPWHVFSMITSVDDTVDLFIAGVNDTGENDTCYNCRCRWHNDTGEQGVWDVLGRVFAWRFQWHYQRPCPTSAAVDIIVLVWISFGGFRLQVFFHDQCHPTSKHSLGAVENLRRYSQMDVIAGVNDTADKCFTDVNGTVIRQCFKYQLSYTWKWEISKNSIKCKVYSWNTPFQGTL